MLLSAIDEAGGFDRREMLLSPAHLGTPNSRLRYFLVARRGNEFTFGSRDELVDPASLLPLIPSCLLSPSSPATLSNYLDEKENEDESDLLLADSVLSRYCQVLDLVRPEATNSCCFTKAYGKYFEGTGHLILYCTHPTTRSIILRFSILQVLCWFSLATWTPLTLACLPCPLLPRRVIARLACILSASACSVPWRCPASWASPRGSLSPTT